VTKSQRSVAVLEQRYRSEQAKGGALHPSLSHTSALLLYATCLQQGLYEKNELNDLSKRGSSYNVDHFFSASLLQDTRSHL
jgi:hypothetical protein